MLSAEPTLAGQLREASPPLLLAPLVRPRLSHDASVGVDLILEGFLAHHGTPRYLQAGDRVGAGVLAGDYCYATGLVAVAGDGDLTVIRVLADLVAVSAVLVSDGRHDRLAPFWSAAVATIAGPRGPEVDAAWERLVSGILDGTASGDLASLPGLDLDALEAVFT
ncbi:MAG: hypothetical protein R2878_00230 [Thermoleophilia bacterium]